MTYNLINLIILYYRYLLKFDPNENSYIIGIFIGKNCNTDQSVLIIVGSAQLWAGFLTSTSPK